MSKHTPGPWKPFPSGIFHDSRSGICVARRHEKAGDEWSANALLIAASPEMLAAHRANAELDVDAIRKEGRLADVLRAIKAEARAVVAKAEGGAA